MIGISNNGGASQAQTNSGFQNAGLAGIASSLEGQDRTNQEGSVVMANALKLFIEGKISSKDVLAAYDNAVKSGVKGGPAIDALKPVIDMMRRVADAEGNGKKPLFQGPNGEVFAGDRLMEKIKADAGTALQTVMSDLQASGFAQTAPPSGVGRGMAGGNNSSIRY
jgi:hypothetical protein